MTACVWMTTERALAKRAADQANRDRVIRNLEDAGLGIPEIDRFLSRGMSVAASEYVRTMVLLLSCRASRDARLRLETEALLGS